MGRIIGIYGESGSGKTMAMRTLNPKTTIYIDADSKGLPWPRWYDQYNEKNLNYIPTDSLAVVKQVFKRLRSGKVQWAKNIVIDSINSLILSEEIKRRSEKGYDEGFDVTLSLCWIFDEIKILPNDFNVIIVALSKTEYDGHGYRFTHIKTTEANGKICMESRMSAVLQAKVENNKFLLETRANLSTSKTPFGAFKNSEIPNDMESVLRALQGY